MRAGFFSFDRLADPSYNMFACGGYAAADERLHAFFEQYLSVSLSSAHNHHLLRASEATEKCVSVSCQPYFLRLGRTYVSVCDAGLHRV